jgi:putative hydrolase of the HAD superfamily
VRPKGEQVASEVPVKSVIFDFFGVVETDGQANEPLLDYIRDELKPRYKIGLLSNAVKNYLPEMLSKEQIALFDVVGISFEMGVGKPDPDAYKIIAKHLDVQPEECIFIDDIWSYCQAAEDVGMKAINYADLQQTLEELKPLLK